MSNDLDLVSACGARLPDGTACAKPPAPGRTRCAAHGGAEGAGGPKGNRNGRYVDGHHGAEAKKRRNWLKRQLKVSRATREGVPDVPAVTGPAHLDATVKFVRANYNVTAPPAGVTEEAWKADLRAVFAGMSDAFIETTLAQLLDAAAINRDYLATSTSMSAALDLLRGLAPQNPFEISLAVHVVQLHMAAAAMNGRIMLLGSTRRTNEEAIAASKLERAFLAAVETFNRVKYGHRQVIRIERVIEVERVAEDLDADTMLVEGDDD